MLVVKDVDLRADPIDWILIEQFTGEPLPYPFKGNIDASVKAAGGPVNRFTVNEGSFFFRDTNVPGATAKGRVNGELDILFPALTKFRGFNLRSTTWICARFSLSIRPFRASSASSRGRRGSIRSGPTCASATPTSRIDSRTASRRTSPATAA